MQLSLNILYKDHDNLRRILYLFEQQIIDIYRGKSDSVFMLQRILAYIQDYPERVHHPAEDAVFAVILNNRAIDEKLRENYRTLMKDHSEIEGLTRIAIQATESMHAPYRQDTGNIGDKLCTLINRQRSHLLYEEVNIYPFIAEYINNEDWEQIAGMVPDYEDPIFDDEIRKEYELIFRSL